MGLTNKELDDLVRRLHEALPSMYSWREREAADAITALHAELAASRAEVAALRETIASRERSLSMTENTLAVVAERSALRQRIDTLEAERDALRHVVAAADAMRDMYVECAQSIDCDMPRTVTAYNAARAALKEGK